MSMFCYQCQETAGNAGCTKVGVCGKQPQTAWIQDVIVYNVKGLCELIEQAEKEHHQVTSDVHESVFTSLFATITNANFDDESLLQHLRSVLSHKAHLRKDLSDQSSLSNYALWNEPESNWMNASDQIGVQAEQNEDLRSLKELITYGIKGLAAYVTHARVLGYVDEELDRSAESVLAALAQEQTADSLVQMTLKTGELGVQALALLDKANTEMYGNPEITQVKLSVGDKPGILISGHDLHDFKELLEQTQDAGVDIYTHSEMLPAHAYPEFKKYPHLKGHYGNAWWEQNREFESFNGPILMTTNCIIPPKESYRDRIYTTGAVGWPGCTYIQTVNGKKDFSALIERAQSCEPPVQIEDGELITGFAHNQVLALADKVVDAVKTGAIKRFFVMAGCDGRQRSREYFTEFAQKLPKDTVILTAGCAKYRYNKLDLGDIGGIPRVLDAGQCNDSYSLAVIALKLQEAFGLDDINKLPLSFNIAWYEQKAVIVLLALLSLGVKNIHLGPTLPGFLSPGVANVLVENFGIAPIGSVDEDIARFLGENLA